MKNAILIFVGTITLTILTSLIPMLIAKTKKIKIIAVEFLSIFVILFFFIYSNIFYVSPEKYKISGIKKQNYSKNERF